MVYSEMEKGKRVCFLGLGLSNLALMRSLPLLRCEVTLRSEGKIDICRVPENISKLRIFEGEDAFKNIDEDILIFSPSIRRERKEFDTAREKGAIFTSDAELFFDLADKPIFAVTGSDGKSTTSTMVSLLLSAAGYKVKLVGNIGTPMVAAIDEETDFYVAELSSFMLRYLNRKVERSALTNITPNHLNWHESFEEYKKTKIKLLENSKKFVISESNLDLQGAFGVAAFKDLNHINKLYSAPLYITKENGYILKNGRRIFDTKEALLKEKHNIQNLMLAIAMTDGYVDDDDIAEVAKSFSGLRHRCQIIHSEGGVDYIDSSIDSTPSRTEATLSSLNRRVVLILGGGGKGLDYSQLCAPIKKYAEMVVISGENADEIYSAVKGATCAEILPDFDSSVRRGIELCENANALLLSPASTSYDRFSSYAERGDRFREIVLKHFKKGF